MAQATPSSGTVVRPFLDVSQVNVPVNPANLTPGTYYGRITVSSPAAVNAFQLITVILQRARRRNLSDRADFHGHGRGSNPASQDFQITSAALATDLSAQTGFDFSILPLGGPGLPSQPTLAHVPPTSPLSARAAWSTALTLDSSPAAG